jgi:hypothetical protein
VVNRKERLGKATKVFGGFRIKKNNALENRKAGIAVFLNKDSINNIVILPKDYRQDDGE